MSNQITGKILHICPTVQVSSKDGSKTIDKRSIVIDCTRFDPYTGERSVFENTPQLEFTGDMCSELDSFIEGQVVTITFDLRGIKYTKDGSEQIFTSIHPYKIELRQSRQQQAVSAQQSSQTVVTQDKGVYANGVGEMNSDGLPF